MPGGVGFRNRHGLKQGFEQGSVFRVLRVALIAGIQIMAGQGKRLRPSPPQGLDRAWAVHLGAQESGDLLGDLLGLCVRLTDVVCRLSPGWRPQ
jgi:hypothetical protein